MVAALFLVKAVAVTAVAVSTAVLSSGGVDRLNLRVQRSIMRLVRDVARVKARRRTNRGLALVPVLFGVDGDDLHHRTLLAELQEVGDGSRGDGATTTVTLEIVEYAELRDAKGGDDDDDDGPLWIAVMGHVFDVRAGAKFYGKGGHYETLSGRDATRALATGNLSATARDHDDGRFDPRRYDDGELAEARRWLEYFATHAKYKHVGRLPRIDDERVDLDAMVDEEIDRRANTKKEEDRPLDVSIGEEEDVDNDDEWDEEDWEDEDDGISRPPEWHPKVASDDQSTCPGGGKSKIKA